MLYVYPNEERAIWDIGHEMPIAMGRVESYTYRLPYPAIRALALVVEDHAGNAGPRSEILLVQARGPEEVIPRNGTFEAGVGELPDDWQISYDGNIWPWRHEDDYLSYRTPEVIWDKEAGVPLDDVPPGENDVQVIPGEGSVGAAGTKALLLIFGDVPGDSLDVVLKWLAPDGTSLPALQEVYPYTNYDAS
jgi:hypothetical protein